jgi:hypothetical protein
MRSRAAQVLDGSLWPFWRRSARGRAGGKGCRVEGRSGQRQGRGSLCPHGYFCGARSVRACKLAAAANLSFRLRQALGRRPPRLGPGDRLEGSNLAVAFRSAVKLRGLRGACQEEMAFPTGWPTGGFTCLTVSRYSSGGRLPGCAVRDGPDLARPVGLNHRLATLDSAMELVQDAGSLGPPAPYPSRRVFHHRQLADSLRRSSAARAGGEARPAEKEYDVRREW